ncbi:MAG: TAXI family TRAP transporter solute-binding subunit [Alphaproteobacteria bacterium]
MKFLQKITLFILATLISTNITYAEDGQKNETDIIIAGGNPFGLRYAQSGKVCGYVNKTDADGNCVVYPTDSSADSISALLEGKVNFAMVQSDWLQHAIDGTSRYSEYGENDNFRLLAVLGAEQVVVVVNKNAGINSLSDLKNKSIDIGAQNTYRNIVSLGLLDVAGLDEGDLKLSFNGTEQEAIDSVCKGKADGAVFILSQPNLILDTMSAQCNVTFVNLADNEIAEFGKNYKGFYKSVIPAETYWSQDGEVNTIGLYTTLITTTDTKKEMVQSVKDGLVNNIEDFEQSHPMLRGVNAENINRNIGVKFYNTTE